MARIYFLLGTFFLGTAFCQSVITTFAGTDWLYPADDRPALTAPLAGILWMGVAADARGNFFVADADNQVILKVGPDGILSVVAGNGIRGFSGDGGPAVNASLFIPTAVAADGNGNLYIAEIGNRIRKVAADGSITTIAGTGVAGFSGDGGPAARATLNHPYAVAVDKAGNVYVADTTNHRVRKISGGIITTVAGNGREGYSGDGGPAIAAALDTPYSVAVDSAGNVYVADTNNYLVRKISPDGVISAVAGAGISDADGVPAFEAEMIPVGVAVDSKDNLYIADVYVRNRIAKVDSAGILTTVAGNGRVGYTGDGGPATQASLNFPIGMAVDDRGAFYIADKGVSRVRKVGADGNISTVAGNGQFRTGGDGAPAASAPLYLPTGMVADAQGNFFIAEPERNRVRKITPDGLIHTVAGDANRSGFSGDGGPASDASLSGPYGVALDSAGNLYIADTENNRIRKVTADGTISTFAGNGHTIDFDDGIAASIFGPKYLVFDRAGNLYFSDSDDQIRKVAVDGTLSTVAGNGKAGYSGDGGPATIAQLNEPYGVAVDAAGNVYIGDYKNNRVRRVDSTGTISTVAGTGASGFSGDGGPATGAALSKPAGIALDDDGNLYIADESNARIRKVTADGIIQTIAGNEHNVFAGDGGPATSAALTVPTNVTLDAAGNVFIADWANNRIRVVLSNPPSYLASPGVLNFSGGAGGPVSAAQNLQLAGTVPGLRFIAAIKTADGGAWLKASTDNGLMPAEIQVSTDPGSLAAGAYSGTITITAPDSSPSVRTIPVNLVVDAATPARLSAKPDALTFTLTQSAAAATQTLTVANEGGGSLNFNAVATTRSGGSWLSLSPLSGTATATAASTVTVTANPAGLNAGTYLGSIAVTGTGTTVTIPVTMTVSATRQTIRLLQSGLTFTAVAGGGVPPRKSFGIQNIGQGSMTWTASAATLSGGSNWLSVTPASGASVALSPDAPQVDVIVDPSRLAAGEYQGRVQVSAAGADNSPQTVSIVLNVLPAGSNPGPVVEPAGLIFTGVAGGVSPGSQNVFVSNLTATPITYGSGRLTLDGKSWFVHLPTDATVTPDRATRIVVQPDLTGLAAGVYHGSLTLVFSGGVTRTVSLLFVVAPASGIGAKAERGADDSCKPSKLAPVFTALSASFNIAAGWPNPMEVRVVDDCGVLMTGGSVLATFSNGDPALSLSPSQPGTWSGTWQPGNTKNPQVTVKVQAELADRVTRGTAEVTGGLRSNLAFPVIARGGVVNSADQALQSPVSPGSLVSILGSGLASTQISSLKLPAPVDLGGTSVLMAGRQLPLLMVSDSRIDAVIPYDIAVNTLQQVIVQRGTSTTVPEAVTVAAVQPAIFTKDGSGRGQGMIYTVSPNGSQVLAEGSTPAKVGDSLVIQCTGLGVVDQPTQAGAAAPDSPLAKAVGVVSVTIGGVAATVTSAGLAPRLTGMYQVKVSTPAGVPPGDAVPVVVTVSGQVSAAVTMAIR